MAVSIGSFFCSAVVASKAPPKANTAVSLQQLKHAPPAASSSVSRAAQRTAVPETRPPVVKGPRMRDGASMPPVSQVFSLLKRLKTLDITECTDYKDVSGRTTNCRANIDRVTDCRYKFWQEQGLLDLYLCYRHFRNLDLCHSGSNCYWRHGLIG